MTILYILFILIVSFLFVTIIPQIIGEMGQFINRAPQIAGQLQSFVNGIQESLQIDLGLGEMVSDIINTQNLESIGQTTLGYLRNAGIILTKFLIGLLLSYIFVIERKPIIAFLAQMK